MADEPAPQREQVGGVREVPRLARQLFRPRRVRGSQMVSALATTRRGLIVTRWSTLTAVHEGRRVAVPWGAFVAELTARGLARFAGDRVHPGWSPATFAGGRRLLKRDVRVHALVGDYDKGGDLDSICATWGEFVGAIHTTRRHTWEHPRFRVILPLARSVTVEEHARLWLWMEARAAARGETLDPAPKCAAQFWYMPGSKTGEFSMRVLPGGEPLDPDAILRQLDAESSPPGERQSKKTIGREAGDGQIEPADSERTARLARIRARLGTLHDAGMRELMRRFIAGEEVVPRHERKRDEALRDACAILAALFPHENVDLLIEILRPTLALWAAEPRAELSLDGELAKARDKFERASRDAKKKMLGRALHRRWRSRAVRLSLRSRFRLAHRSRCLVALEWQPLGASTRRKDARGRACR